MAVLAFYTNTIFYDTIVTSEKDLTGKGYREFGIGLVLRDLTPYTLGRLAFNIRNVHS